MRNKNKDNKTKNNQSNNVKLPRWKEKLDMYDMIIANLIAGKSIIEPQEQLNNSQIYIGFNSIASAGYLTKYYVINEFPDYVPCNLRAIIRSTCMQPGVQINFMTYASIECRCFSL